jgi:XapX domain-containing protein
VALEQRRFYDYLIGGYAMKLHLLSLGAGLLVGIIYGLMNVRSPAPPVIALIGLLGILVGEQAVPMAKRFISSQPMNFAWFCQECGTHIFGDLPVGESRARKNASEKTELP